MSKDKRYDVSQHEGHTEGKWYIDDGDGMVDIDGLWVRLFEPYCDDGITEDEDTINKELMVSAPKILNALKEAYEELDRKNKWLEELDRCPACGKEGFWASADVDAEFDDECRRCGRDNSASE